MIREGSSHLKNWHVRSYLQFYATRLSKAIDRFELRFYCEGVPVSEVAQALSDSAWPRVSKQASSLAGDADTLGEPIPVAVDLADLCVPQAGRIPEGGANRGPEVWRPLDAQQEAEQFTAVPGDRDLLTLRRGKDMLTISWDMLTAMKPSDLENSSHSATPAPTGGVSAFLARVLDQLTLSAWLPGAFLAAGMAILLRFRSEKSASVSNALGALTANPVPVLVIIIPLLIIATIVTQAFSFEAIRTLEGYWRRRGLASLVRTSMIRIHMYRKRALSRRLRKAYVKALEAAKDQIIGRGTSPTVFAALSSTLTMDIELPLSSKKRKELERLEQTWQYSCRPWHLAKIEHLVDDIETYPVDSRILPTKLGNLMRATEDRLQKLILETEIGPQDTDEDMRGFVFRRYDTASQSVQQQHDEYRNRLEMYCVLFFVSAALLVLTPAVLLGSGVGLVAIMIISGSFAALGIASYLAAITSASGYCAALMQMGIASLSAEGDRPENSSL